MRRIFTFLLLFTFYIVAAQDTIQVMQYNLLNYGNYTSYCSSSQNNVNTKNIHLKTIINYVKPDIFTVNELSKTTSYHQMILDQVLNTDGVDTYRKAVSYNYANSYLVNMLYYNNRKLALYSQDVVHSIVRDIDVYTLYYKAGDLAETHDTIFLTCFVAHLKAGTGSSNEDKRASMVGSAMSYIRTHDLPENLLFMGDFNVYKSSEQAYVNLTYTYNGVQYFFDPIDREGHWNNNATYKDVHTQSTHSVNVACFASGGMDDRFDFILSSNSLLAGTRGMLFLNNTYRALGNDGQHFNKGIKDSPTNTSAPADVINAIYHMSDHLPLITKIKVDATLDINENTTEIAAVHFSNPTNSDFHLTINLQSPQRIGLKIYDIFGRLMLERNLGFHSDIINQHFDLNHLSDGAYLVVLTDEKGNQINKKFILKK